MDVCTGGGVLVVINYIDHELTNYYLSFFVPATLFYSEAIYICVYKNINLNAYIDKYYKYK